MAGRRRTQPSDGPLVGTEKPRRFRPRFRYELISCGLAGHELVGTEAARLRPEDAIVAREDPQTGLRWHRCLRCDSWLPLPPPDPPVRELPPPREAIELPLRGRQLRDRYVLRLIALDKLLHFLALSALAAGVLLFTTDRSSLSHPFFRIVTDIQGATGGPTNDPRSHGFLRELRHALSLKQSTLLGVGAAAAGYGLLEGLEGLGLWFQKRWAEYLTFVATGIPLPFEVYELSHKVSAFKVLALIINLAIVVWLLYSKRLFGIRGGWRAEEREREQEMGWPALEATTPGLGLGGSGGGAAPVPPVPAAG